MSDESLDVEDDAGFSEDEDMENWTAYEQLAGQVKEDAMAMSWGFQNNRVHSQDFIMLLDASIRWFALCEGDDAERWPWKNVYPALQHAASASTFMWVSTLNHDRMMRLIGRRDTNFMAMCRDTATVVLRYCVYAVHVIRVYVLASAHPAVVEALPLDPAVITNTMQCLNHLLQQGTDLCNALSAPVLTAVLRFKDTQTWLSSLGEYCQDLQCESAKICVTDLLYSSNSLQIFAQLLDLMEPYALLPLMHLLSVIIELDRGYMADNLQHQDESAQQVVELDAALNSMMERLVSAVETDPDKLADRERAYTQLSRVFDQLYTAKCVLGDYSPQTRILAHQQVSILQRAFVARMLKSTNFNNLLSAARECQRLLSRACDLQDVDQGAALQDMDAWMADHQVIHTLLKANLHQRQYADLVLAILQILTRYQRIRSEHLDQLWGATEAEGTFDVVKTNVYNMIQDLAQDLNTELMNRLFTKFEGLAQQLGGNAPGRLAARGQGVAGSISSREDVARLLDLLKKLATSSKAQPQTPDGENPTGKRLLGLIWQFLIPVTGNTGGVDSLSGELQAADTMADVLQQYGHQIGHMQYCKDYLEACCQQLAKKTKVVPALRLLRRLIGLFEEYDRQRQVTAQQASVVEEVLRAATEQVSNLAAPVPRAAVAPPEPALPLVMKALEAQFNLQTLLLNNLLDVQAQAKAALAAQHAQQVGTAAAAAVPSDLKLPGSQASYKTLLVEYLETVSLVASKQTQYYPTSHILRIWDSLVTCPCLSCDADLGLDLVLRAASSSAAGGEFLSGPTQKELLDTRITALRPAGLTATAWAVASQFLIKVNVEEQLLSPLRQDEVGPVSSAFKQAANKNTNINFKVVKLDGVHGVDFLWRVALEARDATVAQQAAELLIQVYVRGSKGQPHETDAINTFIRRCVSSSMTACHSVASSTGEALDWGPQQQHDDVFMDSQRQPEQPGPAAAGSTDQLLVTLRRCLDLMVEAAEAGQLSALPRVVSHQSSYQAMPVELDIHLPHDAARRCKVSLPINEYVGQLRRMVAAELGQQPHGIRLIAGAGGPELRNDAAILSQALTRSSPDGLHTSIMRQITVFVTPQPPGYYIPSKVAAAAWHSTAIAQLAAQPGLYPMLLYLADHPHWPELCRPSQRLLALLPTHSDIVHQLAAAFDTSATDEAALKLHALLQCSHHISASDMVVEETPVYAGTAQSPYAVHAVVKPARLTYMLQALHGLLYPSPTALQCILSSQKQSQPQAQQNDEKAVDEADKNLDDDVIADVAGIDDPAPNTVRRLPTVAACLPVLYSMLRRSAAAVTSCTTAHSANSNTSLVTLQVLEFHTQLVHLLNNLCKKDTVQALQAIAQGKGYAALRPLPLELVLVSAHAHSPSTGGTGALGTPTGPMQGLSVAGGSTPEAEDTCAMLNGATATGHSGAATDAQRLTSTATQLSSGAAHAVAVVGAATSIGGVPSPPFSGGYHMACEADASDGAVAVGLTLQESPPQSLVGLLVTTCTQAVSLLRQCSASMSHQQEVISDDATYNAVCSEATQLVREGLNVLQRMLVKMPELYNAFLAYTSSSELVSSMLICDVPTVGPTMRSHALRFLEHTCLPHPPGLANYNINRPGDAAVWLMGCVIRSKEAALTAREPAKEFWQVATEVVTQIPKINSSDAQSVARQLAGRLLDQEMSDLIHIMTTLGPLDNFSPRPYELHQIDSDSEDEAAAQQQAMADPASQVALAALGSAPADPPPEAACSSRDYRTLVTPAAQDQLTARLQLTANLLRVLGRNADSAANQSPLVKVLLQRYLFPESAIHAHLDRQYIHTVHLQACFGWCAHTDQARSAALDILQELMSASADNFTVGAAHLSAFHGVRSRVKIERLPCTKEPPEPLRAQGGYCGLRNGGATCYMNAVIQQLFMHPRVRTLLLSATPPPRKRATSSDGSPEAVCAQLQGLMATLALSCAGSVRPDKFWGSLRDFDGEPIDLKEHQDAQEFFTRLQDLVDSYLTGSHQTPALAAVFGGKFVQQIISKEGPQRSERDEDFYHVSVDVKGKGNLAASLASYVQGELMEGENAWQCEELGKKVSAIRRQAFKTLPPSLVVHLKRFEYDHMANQRFKLRERFEFPAVLDMYPYTAEGLAAADAAAAAAVAAASQQGGGSSSTASSSCSNLGGDSSMGSGPSSPSGESVAGVTSGDGNTDRSKYLYELRGVVVHSGSAFAGHYYSYVKERPHVRVLPDGSTQTTSQGSWFLFDDRNVVPWDPAQMEDQCFGGPISKENSSNPSSSMDLSTGGGEPEERAYSAFLLFYDRVDGSCVEVDPVPSFAPAPPSTTPATAPPPSPSPTPVSTHAMAAAAATLQQVQAQKATAMSAPSQPRQNPQHGSLEQQQQQPQRLNAVSGSQQQQAVQRRITGDSTDSHMQEQVQQADGAPYGMPSELYQSILRDNVFMLRRYRAAQPNYLEFIRKVCEARVERAMSDRKSRRTHRMDPRPTGSGSDADVPSPGGGASSGAISSHGASKQTHGSVGVSGGGAEPAGASPGTGLERSGSGLGPVGGTPGSCQDAPSRREAGIAEASCDAMGVMLDLLLHVLLQSPAVWQVPELSNWATLIYRLLEQHSSVTCRAARVLLSARDLVLSILQGDCNRIPSRSVSCVVQLVESVMCRLTHDTQVYLSRLMHQPEGQAMDQAQLVDIFRRYDATVAHTTLLEEFCINPINAMADRVARGIDVMRRYDHKHVPRDQQDVYHDALDPYLGYSAQFRLLAMCIYQGAVCAFFFDHGWADGVVLAVQHLCLHFSDCWPGLQSEYNLQSETSEAISCLVQILLTCQDLTHVLVPNMAVDSRTGRAPQPVWPNEQSRTALKDRAARICDYPAPPALTDKVVLSLDTAFRLSPKLLRDSQQPLVKNGMKLSVVCQALVIPWIAADTPAPILAHLLAHNDMSFSLNAINAFLHMLNIGFESRSSRNTHTWLTALRAIPMMWDMLVFNGDSVALGNRLLRRQMLLDIDKYNRIPRCAYPGAFAMVQAEYPGQGVMSVMGWLLVACMFTFQDFEKAVVSNADAIAARSGIPNVVEGALVEMLCLHTKHAEDYIQFLEQQVHGLGDAPIAALVVKTVALLRDLVPWAEQVNKWVTQKRREMQVRQQQQARAQQQSVAAQQAQRQGQQADAGQRGAAPVDEEPVEEGDDLQYDDDDDDDVDDDESQGEAGADNDDDDDDDNDDRVEQASGRDQEGKEDGDDIDDDGQGSPGPAA